MKSMKAMPYKSVMLCWYWRNQRRKVWKIF
ncbi:Uncharacterised protein [Vibrio cholerae]|nr:Uncharacterised protein [Vibrio cholerae]